MLTLIDAISLAGDRLKQNDDSGGVSGAIAWVIDGATDLHDAPLTGAASDAAWVAHGLNALLHGERWGDGDHAALLDALRRASAALRAQFLAQGHAASDLESWKSPIASALIVAETRAGLLGVDLGDCRLFVRDEAGHGAVLGGPAGGVDREVQSAAKLAREAGPGGEQLYRTPAARDVLREQRARQVANPGANVFGLDQARIAHARVWNHPMARPAHVLLSTDGFAALVDRYAAYDPAGLLAAALESGLAALSLELRAIEHADASGARHPRFKRSDDATALLLRLT